ncbi:MAG TPA: 30S ribosomal protein S12 methylthiotransferase RimO [Myxococcales bacterium]|nr:30S ribosomal protein S12 methylthiotransferase RimO [Myxococcales bacterium]
MSSLYLLTLGCPKNRVDSEIMLGGFARQGYRLVQDPAKADVIVVNTCSFIGPAKEESVDAILELGRYKDPEAGQCETLVVAGCLAQRYGPDLQKDMPEVDHLVGTSAYAELPDLLAAHAAPKVMLPDPDYVHDAATPRINSLPSYTAYLKISEGCDNQCQFCIIPKLRGTQRSRPIADVVREAKDLVSRGAVELNLVAQDLTAYGHDLPGRPRLHDLLEALCETDARWLRLHYAYPRDFPDRLIDVLARADKVVKYLDMPLQHCSDRLLRRMRRGRDSRFLRDLLAELRARVPGLVMRTSLIAGLPGETEADFEELRAFVAEQRFERLGVFEYSDEEGTGAYEMDGKVPARTIRRRRRELMALQRRINRQQNRALVGRRLEVLVEGPSPETEHLLVGRHAGQAPEIDGQVYVNRGMAEPGSLAMVLVEQAADYDLVGGIDDGIEVRPPPRPASYRLPLLA